MKWLTRWLRRLFRRPLPMPAAPIEIAPPPRPNRPPKAAVWDDMLGAHYHFGDLLEELDDYFDILHYMRRVDGETYKLYRRLGAQIVGMERDNDQTNLIPMELPAEWRSGPRMGLGMIHMTGRKKFADGEKSKPLMEAIMPGAFMSFMRKHHFVGHPPRDGSTYYECKIYWHDDRHAEVTDKAVKKYGPFHGDVFWIEVTANLDIVPLKMPCDMYMTIPASKRRHYRKTRIKGIGWHYGYLTRRMRETEEFQLPLPGDATVEALARYCFALMVNSCYQASEGLQVRVRKEGVTARFNIGLLRTPYFFKDREKTVNVRGNSKRIFHIVRAHRRITAGGAERYVRSHFRGERRFNWNGYAVVISMPGWHHRRFEEFDIEAWDAEEDKPAEASVGIGYVAKILDKHMDREKRP